MGNLQDIGAHLGHAIQRAPLLFEGGIAAAVFALLAGVWFCNGDPVIIIGAIVFALLVGGIGIAAAPNIPISGKIGILVFLTTAALGDGGFIYWHNHPAWHPFAQQVVVPPPQKTENTGSPQQALPNASGHVGAPPPSRKAVTNAPTPSVPGEVGKPAASPSILPLLIECSHGFMPTLSVGPNDRVPVLYVYPREQAVLAQMFLLKGGELNLSKNGKFPPPAAWTCKAINYGSVPLISVMVGIRIDWWKVTKEKNTMHMSDHDQEVVYPVAFSKQIDPGSNNPFVFYILNNSDEFARIMFQPEGVGTPIDTGVATRLPARSDPLSLDVWPDN